MRSIKITDLAQSKEIEAVAKSEDISDIVSIKSSGKAKEEEKQYYEEQEVRKDAKYQKKFNFPSKYHYFVFLMMFQNSNDMIPITVRHVLTFSGGGFLLLLVAVGVIIVFPLMYIEIFLGSYTQRTNSHIYKMAPVFFGVTCFIWLFTILLLLVPTVEESVVLAHFIKRLSNIQYNLSCPIEDSCYNYNKRGTLQDKNCKYYYMSMICDDVGEIRYLEEYHYWNTYKRSDENKNFPVWEIVVGVIVEWFIITLVLIRGLKFLVKLHNFGFLFKLVVFTVILVTAITKEGSGDGIHHVFYISVENMTIKEIVALLGFYMFRCGLIFPVGIMTYSSCLPHRTATRSESVTIWTIGLIMTVFYLVIIFGVMGVLGNNMGVDGSNLYVPYRGIFLALIPQFLMHYNDGIIFASCYYFALIFPEIIRYAIHIHMWLLNLYDFMPKYRKHHTYVCLTSCGIFCASNMIGLYKPLHTTIIPTFYAVYTTYCTIIYLALQMTMICYVYGITRLIDDIHFLVGYNPNKLSQYVWATFPIVLYASFIYLHLSDERISIEWDLPPGTDGRKYVKMMGTIQIINLIVVVLLSIIYILSKLGIGISILSFFKPHRFWGPPDFTERLNRKHFKPRKAIRSQPEPIRITNLQDKLGNQPEPVSEEEREHHRQQILESRIFSDTKFFQMIGIPANQMKMWTYSVRTGESMLDAKDEIE